MLQNVTTDAFAENLEKSLTLANHYNLNKLGYTAAESTGGGSCHLVDWELPCTHSVRHQSFYVVMLLSVRFGPVSSHDLVPCPF